MRSPFHTSTRMEKFDANQVMRKLRFAVSADPASPRPKILFSSCLSAGTAATLVSEKA